MRKNKPVQRMMKFVNNVEDSSIEPEHEFCFDFSKKYIKDKIILDIGCWTGAYAKLIKNIASKITVVDIEKKVLKVVKKNLPEIECYKAYSHNLPFKDKSFNVVTLWAVIEHIPVGYELATLKEINRVLKPEGYFFITTMNKSFWSDMLDPAYWLVGHRHYSDIQLKSMLADAGFTIENLKISGGFITAMHAWGFYFFKHIFHLRMPKINFIEKKFAKDFVSPGFYQIAIRARKNGK